MAPVDSSNFVNTGAFFEKHPDVIKDVTRFEQTDAEGHILESWERNKNGEMVETTERDLLRQKYIKAKEEVDKISVKKVIIE